jgi:hypothetical protein
MTDTDHFDTFAETCRTQADYCRHMAEEPDGAAFDESWALLAAAWTKLAEETKARSGIAAELTMYSGRQMRT